MRKISFQTHYISFGVVDHLAIPHSIMYQILIPIEAMWKKNPQQQQQQQQQPSDRQKPKQQPKVKKSKTKKKKGIEVIPLGVLCASCHYILPSIIATILFEHEQ
ncbi:hypothetical protein ACHAWU_004171 [Discostella pseudostelligera]|uniref:Uncharacterized protein n=1 Tax=Discostella pseudostelligera TaxID=259834 RepID=A0ABD3MQ79_9STRA